MGHNKGNAAEAQTEMANLHLLGDSIQETAPRSNQTATHHPPGIGTEQAHRLFPNPPRFDTRRRQQNRWVNFKRSQPT